MNFQMWERTANALAPQTFLLSPGLLIFFFGDNGLELDAMIGTTLLMSGQTQRLSDLELVLGMLSSRKYGLFPLLARTIIDHYFFFFLFVILMSRLLDQNLVLDTY